MFREWAPPKTKKELLKLTPTLPFLRNYILGRTYVIIALRSGIIEEVVKTTVNGKAKTTV